MVSPIAKGAGHRRSPAATSALILGLAALVTSTATAPADVVINEIHYNAEPNTASDEFIELHNTEPADRDVSGWFLDGGIDFVFPPGTTIPGQGFAVVAQSPEALQAKGVSAMGPFGRSLSGQSDLIVLRDASGRVVDEVEYRNEFPWPVGADGTGASMELIHPGLDNDLGGSWRSSLVPGALPEATLLGASAEGWRWHPGDVAPSTPADAWRGSDFEEGPGWAPATLPIGYGGVGDIGAGDWATPATGMQGGYASLFLRREFEVAPGEIPPRLILRAMADDGLIAWINGVEVVRANVPAGDLPLDATADGSNLPEGDWEEFVIESPGAYLVEGSNTLAVRLLNDRSSSSDGGIDIELMRPASGEDEPPRPTPGAVNSVFSAEAPPQVRQVGHLPSQPAGDAPVVVSAKVTDPDGVASVRLEYQVVVPGAYVPAFLAKTHSRLLSDPNGPLEPNPLYWDESAWTVIPMADEGEGGDAVEGDDVYSVTLPGRPNRTLVRYRIVVEDTTGQSVRVPYADDPSLNFAWFVYDGVPDYVAGTRSVLGGPPQTHSSDVLTSVPVYHLLCDDGDYAQCVAYSGNQIPRDNYDARSAYNWTGTFVYDGEVYDNIGYRLRQRNARYSGSGKRSFKFRFNPGRYVQFHDMDGNPYPEKWKFLATHKMISSRGNATWGLEQASNHILWNLTGTPAPWTHWFHFRVVKGEEEAPSGSNGQYFGDFYGLMLALEEYDVRFLNAHNLEKGNLYKLISGRTDGVSVRRYLAADGVDDGSDFRNIIFQLRANKTDEWLLDHVNYDQWNRYHAIVDAVRHYDVQPNTAEHLKNRAYYFEPSATNPLGRLWVLPWDSDTSWGPNWNGGEDFCKQAAFGPGGVTQGRNPRPQFTIEYKNVVREIRDLAWTEEQIDLLLDSLTARIAPFVPADRDRWTSAPSSAGTQSDPPIERVVADMKRFAFDGGSWVGGDSTTMEAIARDTGVSGREGRDAYLDALAEDPEIPATPTIAYDGPEGFPQGPLAFSSSAFSDPQGVESFGAVEWRLAEIRLDLADPRLEIDANWTSGPLESPEDAFAVAIPASELKVGRTYRVRARHRDADGRWSHWSAPLEFTVSEPVLDPWIANLMVTEIMYHPAPPSDLERAADPTLTAGDFEWIEVANVGDSPLDLSSVRFTKGIDFDFATGSDTVLAPGERFVIVDNPAAFNLRYGFAATPTFVVGDFNLNLSDGGEVLKLSFGGGTAIREFAYDDAPPWPTAPDGEGASLVLVDPASRPDHAEAANWRASSRFGGSPGAEDPAPDPIDDPLADADGDGIQKIIEVAVGASDLVAGPPPEIGIAAIGPEWILTVPRNPDAWDIGLVVEVSDDLVAWRPAPLSGWLPDAGDGFRSEHRGARTTAGRLYVRLRATAAAP